MQRSSRLFAAVASAALAAAVLPGAVASGHGTTPTIGGGGVLLLNLDRYGDYLKFLPATGSGEASAIQRLSSWKCVASASPAASLAKLSALPAAPAGAVGLADHSLGVKSGSETYISPSCALVNGTSESLSLGLGTTLAAKTIDFAELDVETFNSVKLVADTYLDGHLRDTTTLSTGGSSATTASRSSALNHNPPPAHHNVRWVVNPPNPFDTIVLRVDPSTPAGAFQLEGGSRGTPPAPGGVGAALRTGASVFQLSDFTGSLDCGESSGDITTEPGAPTADLTRGQNASCEPIPYLLRTGSDTQKFVLLEKDLGDQTGTNFRMDIVWPDEPAPVGSLRITTIDYDGPGGADPQPVQWCGGTPSAPTLPGTQKWCLVSQQVTLAGSGNVSVAEGYFGSGDPRWAR